MFVKRVVFFVVIIVAGFIINNLGHSIYSLLQKKTLVSNAQQELDRQKNKNLELKNKLKVVKRPQFVEEEARNKLFLAKPGEGIVIVPSGALEAKLPSKSTPKDASPNWKKWWELFF